MYIVLYDSTLARGTLPSWELFPSLLLLPHALMLSRTHARTHARPFLKV